MRRNRCHRRPSLRSRWRLPSIMRRPVNRFPAVRPLCMFSPLPGCDLSSIRSNWMAGWRSGPNYRTPRIAVTTSTWKDVAWRSIVDRPMAPLPSEWPRTINIYTSASRLWTICWSGNSRRGSKRSISTTRIPWSFCSTRGRRRPEPGARWDERTRSTCASWSAPLTKRGIPRSSPILKRCRMGCGWSA